MDQLGSREVGLPKACSLPGPRWSNRGDFFSIIGPGEYRVTRPTLDQL